MDNSKEEDISKDKNHIMNKTKETDQGNIMNRIWDGDEDKGYILNKSKKKRCSGITMIATIKSNAIRMINDQNSGGSAQTLVYFCLRLK